MVKRIYVDNVKSLVNFELPLQELALLMGVNGAGKTSVLDAIFAIRQLLSGSAKVGDKSIFPAATLTRWQSIDVSFRVRRRSMATTTATIGS